MVTGVRCRPPSPPRFLPSIYIAHRFQQSHCSSIVHRVLLTHALALSAGQFVLKKKSQQIYTSIVCTRPRGTHETDLYQARGKPDAPPGRPVTFFFFFFPHTFAFQLLDKPWSQVSSLLPPGFCLQFLSRIGSSNPTARRFFIECC